MYRALLVALALLAPASAHARERAPGAPGDKADWTSADKQGFGTSATRASRVWFTLRNADMTEVHYPDLSHPSARSLEFMVDGRRVTTGTVTQQSLVYTQTSSTSKWRLVRTYVTDPERATVLIRVRFESVDGKDHDLEIAYDPQLYNDGSDDVGWTRGQALLAHDRKVASALVARPSLTRTSSGYVGHDEHLLEHTYDALRPGNVVQQAHTRLTGRGDRRDMTVALGFAPRATTALETAQASIVRGFDAISAAYAKGWTDYRASLLPIPAAAVPVAAAYDTSLFVLKAHEDKENRGAFVASPSMPWGWGELRIDEDNPRSGPYHLVWPRDLYQVATALHAAGDTAAANRALDFLFAKQQLDDGSFPQNTQVDGRPKWTGLQMDQVGLPIVLAWQLGRTSRSDWGHVRRAADLIVDKGPVSEQERWENQEGYSPGHDRGPDRGADLRGRHRAQERLGRARGALRAHGRLLGAQRRALDGDDERPVLAQAVLPAPHQGPQAEPRHDLQHRRLRAVEARPAPGRRRQLPRAGPAGRQALRRPRDPEHAAGRRPAAEGGRVLAPVQLRRLRGAPGRQVLAAVRRGHAHDARSGVADLRRRARRVRAARGPLGGRAPGGDGGRGQRRRDAAGAGLGRPRADRQAGLPDRRGHVLRDAFGLVPRTVGEARVVRGSRSAGRAPEDRCRPLLGSRRPKRYPSLPTSRRSGVFL